MDRSPLVEVLFNLDKDPGSSEFSGLKFSCDRNPKRALHFDLFFNFVEGPSGLVLECDYNSDLFEQSTINRWLGHFETLLAGMAAGPAEVLDKLPYSHGAGTKRDHARLEQHGSAIPTRTLPLRIY